MGQACTALRETMKYGGGYMEARPSMGFGHKGQVQSYQGPKSEAQGEAGL